MDEFIEKIGIDPNSDPSLEGVLKLYRLNRLANQWVPLPVQSIDIANNKIKAELTALGLFVVGCRPLSEDPPVADDQIVRTLENTPVPITLTASITDTSAADQLEFDIVGPPANGTLIPMDVTSENEKTFIYIPNDKFVGFDFFAFEAEHNNQSSVAGTVAIFVEAVNPSVGSEPVAVAAGDLNGNTFLDLVVANRSSNNLSILQGRGDGSFIDQQPDQQPMVGGPPSAVALADVNGDDVLDILVTIASDTDNLLILLGNQDGDFDSAVRRTFSVGNAPSSVATADFNIDGNIDIVTANQDSDDVSILIGQGGGATLSQRPNLSAWEMRLPQLQP